MLEDDIRTYLLTQLPITTLVGTDSTGSPARIWPQDRRQSITASAIVYTRLNTDHLHTLTAAAGYATAFVEFECFGATYAAAKALGEALRGELQGYRGAMGSTTIRGVLLEDESDVFYEPEDGSAKGSYSMVAQYSFQFVESVPTF